LISKVFEDRSAGGNDLCRVRNFDSMLKITVASEENGAVVALTTVLLRRSRLARRPTVMLAKLSYLMPRRPIPKGH